MATHPHDEIRQLKRLAGRETTYPHRLTTTPREAIAANDYIKPTFERARLQVCNSESSHAT